MEGVKRLTIALDWLIPTYQNHHEGDYSINRMA